MSLLSAVFRCFLFLAALAAPLRAARVQQDDLVETIKLGIEDAEQLLRAGDEAAARTCIEELASLIAKREDLASKEEVEVLWKLGNVLDKRKQMLPVQLAVNSRILAALEARLEKTHPKLQDARANLAMTRHALGDYAGALVLEEAVLAAWEATPDANQTDVLRARQDVAWYRNEAGDVRGALGLQETVVAARRRLLAPDDPDLLRSEHTLAWILKEAGDLERAQALEEAVLEAREKTFASDHPEVVAARHNLALMKWEAGDLEGASALLETVVDAYERQGPRSRELMVARSSLAAVKQEMGDYPGAFALQQVVLEARKASLPEDHPDLIATRLNIAGLLRLMGRLDEAETLGGQALASLRGKLSEDHPDLVKAAEGLAMTKRDLGKLGEASTLLEGVLASRQRTLPAGHPDVLHARELLIWTKVEAGEAEAAASLLDAQREGILALHLQALDSSPREACAVVGTETPRVDQVLSLEKKEQAGVFTLLETRRHAATAPAAGSADPALEELWRKASRARSELNDLVLGGTSAEELSTWREKMNELSLARDKALAAVRRKLAEEGRLVEAIRPEALAGRLPAGALAVGFHRYERWEKDPGSARVRSAGPALLAMVLGPGGTVHRVELGPVDELEALVSRWRMAMESSGGRGISSASAGSSPVDVLEVGRTLRTRILDPVLAAAGLKPGAPTAGDTRGHEVFVCLDDFLHLLPLDALPLEENGLVVGDRFRIRNEVSFARLLEPRKPAVGKGLLAVGDVDYEAASAGEVKAVAASSAPLRSGERSGSLSGWRELQGTKKEVGAIAGLYEGAFGEKASRLEREKATKAALLENARGKRFVHVATHGWFAPEGILSSLDAGKTGDEDFRSSAGSRVQGLAPMTLCGLCLSGANKGRDELGRVPGLLTAEELAGFDLSACDLAVLSACETNVGLRRAGQGILSLQSALHSAGARTTVTSLWRVNDELTGELMERFYRNLWTKKMSKSDALWLAKKDLRQQGHPLSAWAGWVLSGEP